jgi:plasmid replication initiation protein
MKIDEQIEITTKREYLVFKHNDLAQKSRFELSVPEQKTIAYMCSMIKPVDESVIENGGPFQLEYTFDINAYAAICGLQSDGGQFYNDTKALLKGLLTKVVHLVLPDGTEGMVTWFTGVWTNKRSSKVRVEVNKHLAPYLFGLKQDFFAYELLNILAMKSQYSIRIYEILRSYANLKLINFEIDELKKRLMVDVVKSYVNFKDFRRYVLDIAMKEINQYTDLIVSYETITKGRKVIQVEFHMSKKPDNDKKLIHNQTNDGLDLNKLNNINDPKKVR